MKKLIKHMTFILIVLTFISASFLTASATTIDDAHLDITKKGSIYIDYKYEDIALADVNFKVYQISTVDANNEHSLLSNFSNIDVDLDKLTENDYWMQFSEILENYINSRIISPDIAFTTNDKGQYKLTDLDLGIYFIQADTVVNDGKKIFSKPILIAVGNYDKTNDMWVYSYDISPKMEVISEEMYDLSILKVWKNTNSELLIPKEIVVELYKNAQLYETITLSKENTWSYTLENIDPSANWTVKEITKLENFKVDYHKDGFKFTVTNTYIGKDDEELPQTGSFAHLIPIFSSLGLIFISVGILLKYKVRYKK